MGRFGWPKINKMKQGNKRVTSMYFRFAVVPLHVYIYYPEPGL